MEKIKRTKAFRIICAFFIIMYGVFFSIFPFYQFQLHNAWFSLGLNFIGITLITRGVFYSLDSSMFLGLTLYLFSLIGIVDAYVVLSFKLIFYFLAFALANIIVFFIFRQNIHFILFALSVVEVVILVIKNLLEKNFWFWIIQSGFFLFIFFLLAILIRKAKENKSAISE